MTAELKNYIVSILEVKYLLLGGLMSIITIFFMISCGHKYELSNTQIRGLFEQVLEQNSKMYDLCILDEVIVVYPDKAREYLKMSDMAIEEIQELITCQKVVYSKDITVYHVVFTDNSSLIVSRDISMDCGEEVCGIIEHYYFVKRHDQWEFERWLRVAQT